MWRIQAHQGGGTGGRRGAGSVAVVEPMSTKSEHGA
jgi:hypothetical protein